MPYDDPATGKHFDFEWEAYIYSRTAGCGCPFISGRAVYPGFNDLATLRPDLAAEWHPVKNGDLTPDMVTISSGQKVWWLLPYDDPKTGKHFDFEWESYIASRVSSLVNGRGCPFLSGRVAWPGFNDLLTTHPDLAAEWHPTKNGDLTPDKILAGSDKKIWWKCLKCGHEWEAKTYNRSNKKKRGCPSCKARKHYGDAERVIAFYLSRIFPKLETNKRFDWSNGMEVDIYIPDLNIYIEYDGYPWHKNRLEKDLEKYRLCKNHGINGIHIREPNLPDFPEEHILLSSTDTKDLIKAIEILLKAILGNIPHQFELDTEKHSQDIAKYIKDVNKNKSLLVTHPELCKEWHYKKNNPLTPENFSAGTGKKVWWLVSYDDPETGQHFDFEWEAGICSRARGNGCPYLSGKAVWIGFNDLKTKRPDIAAEWHPTKNGDLTPDKVVLSSNKKAWWLLSYDDPETGQHFDFEWEAKINHRTNGNGCPFLSGNKVWPGFNDLATKRPDLAAEWHPTKNGDLMPDMVTAGSTKTVWWYLPYDDPETGKHFDFEWKTSIAHRVAGDGCPYLSGKAVWIGFNDLKTKRPDIAAEWHPTKNGDLMPEQVTCGSNKKVWWLLPYDDPKTGKHFDFEWEAQINYRTKGGGCPYLTGRAVWPGFND